MKTGKKKQYEISTADIARLLGWNYEDAQKVRQRKSPKHRYTILINCENELIKGKAKLNNSVKKKLEEKFNQ